MKKETREHTLVFECEKTFAFYIWYGILAIEIWGENEKKFSFGKNR